MKVLVTGRGTGGSWSIRGMQLGMAAGFKVAPGARSLGEFDMVVAVKRVEPWVPGEARRAGTMLVWDAVDAWPQPHGNRWAREAALKWLEEELARLRPDFVIGATEAMSRDVRALGVPSEVVYHHGRDALPAQHVTREKVQVVGYEGGAAYISQYWRKEVEKRAARRGWVFVVNPPRLSDVDIVLGLRDDDGYPPRMWKSNVKLANAQIAALPFIGVPETGYRETASGAERFVERGPDLNDAFDAFAPYRARVHVGCTMLEAAPTLKACAARCRQVLEAAHAARA